MVRGLFLAGVIVATGAFQGRGAAPTAPPPYEAKFTVETDTGGQVYLGTTTFVVDAKGVVTGNMALTQPIGVTATLSGAVKDGVWTFEYSYSIPEQNCSGTVKGTGKVPADRKIISGAAAILGACVQQPLNSTFSFTLQEKKGG